MKLNGRKIFLITVLAICVIAINLAVYFQITQKPKDKGEDDAVNIDTIMLTENFNNIFDNQLNLQNNEINVNKVDFNKEVVYTSYANNKAEGNTSEFNVNIPCLNIQNEVAQTINNEINSIFYQKAEDILRSGEQNTNYNVNYKAYINDNILSLIIKATLKEGNNPQRVIIKTYNYNLSSNSNLGIREILEYRKISTGYAQSKIKEAIQLASEEATRYKELGYNMYLRNVNNEMYLLENTSVYFIGEGKAVYILYPYGNSNYTSELDIVVI